jgi:RNA polymerase sigma-70 factor (ECF subfamily)
MPSSDLRNRKGESTFTDFYRMNEDRVRATIRKLVSNPDEHDDLAQQVFLRAYRNRSQFRGDAAYSTWITRIAINVCASYHRTRLRVRDQQIQWQHEFVTLQATVRQPEQDLQLTETRSVLHERLKNLPTNYRKAIHLRFYEQKSYREISQDLNVPIGTIKIWLHRGRAILKQRINREIYNSLTC